MLLTTSALTGAIAGPWGVFGMPPFNYSNGLAVIGGRFDRISVVVIMSRFSAVRFFVAIALVAVRPGILFTGAAGGTVTRYFLGNDAKEWRTEIRERRFSGNWTAQESAKLSWSRYIGDRNETTVQKIAVGPEGSTYVAGSRVFPDFIRTGGFTGFAEVSVTKLDKSGNIVYQTFLGGKGDDRSLGIAVDAVGNAYVVGRTASPNFPLRQPLQVFPAGGFIAKLDTGGNLSFSTYFGADLRDSVNAVATDGAGNAYVTGETFSATFPITPGAFQATGDVSPVAPPITSTGFVGKLSSDGTALVYSTYLGGRQRACGTSGCLSIAQYDRPAAISVDSAGAAFIAGISNKLEFPVTPGAFQPSVLGPFVTKLVPNGSGLDFSTGLGGPLDETADIAVNGNGEVYLTGSTASPSFPTTPGAFQPVLGGQADLSPLVPPPPDAFLAKFDRAGSSLVYSSYLGGPGEDRGLGLVVGERDSVFVTGISEQLALPGADTSLPGGRAFVAGFDRSGSQVFYSARFPNGAAGADIALVGAGNLRLAGSEGYVAAIDLDAGPGRAIMALSSAAATRVSGRVAPGEIVAIWGQGLGPAEPMGGVVEGGFVTKSLSETQVFFDGLAAPLLYVSERQINAVAPFGIAGRLRTQVRVVYQRRTTGDLVLGVIAHAPEVFRDQDGRSAAALNEDWTVNSAENPAKAGSVVAVFLTGIGTLQPLPEDGSVHNPPTPVIGLSIDNLEVLYAGAAPDLVAGAAQVNFRLPQQQFAPSYAFTVTMGTYRSEPATVYVTQ